jgi:serine/threonine-protein kinase RsbW
MSMKPRVKKPSLQRASDLPWTTITFESCLDRAHRIEKEILEACRRHRYGDHDLFALKLALEEALVNAVKHGNKMDKCKCVSVQYRVTPQRVDVTVEDQGNGFNPADVPDCTADENLECNHGRGILLMRAYMSSVVFSPTGNKVTLTKFNEGQDEPSAQQASLA